ncbi:hypothetical protein PAPYR_2322 [Paratrimastix pyriformis]|uniref:Uncharacterized protein n=1 Tax=Paratrimastix pyriformis TaxID=342808 RepID=A0ABQ8UV85_9EUKA|nr:hypothetical protein PAPYR_2322 [Paratrimastix pyriformis]
MCESAPDDGNYEELLFFGDLPLEEFNKMLFSPVVSLMDTVYSLLGAIRFRLSCDTPLLGSFIEFSTAFGGALRSSSDELASFLSTFSREHRPKMENDLACCLDHFQTPQTRLQRRHIRLLQQAVISLDGLINESLHGASVFLSSQPVTFSTHALEARLENVLLLSDPVGDVPGACRFVFDPQSHSPSTVTCRLCYKTDPSAGQEVHKIRIIPAAQDIFRDLIMALKKRCDGGETIEALMIANVQLITMLVVTMGSIAATRDDIIHEILFGTRTSIARDHSHADSGTLTIGSVWHDKEEFRAVPEKVGGSPVPVAPPTTDAKPVMYGVIVKKIPPHLARLQSIQSLLRQLQSCEVDAQPTDSTRIPSPSIADRKPNTVELVATAPTGEPLFRFSEPPTTWAGSAPAHELLPARGSDPEASPFGFFWRFEPQAVPPAPMPPEWGPPLPLAPQTLAELRQQDGAGKGGSPADGSPGGDDELPETDVDALLSWSRRLSLEDYAQHSAG